MSSTSKDKLITVVVTSIISLATASGGSYAVNSNLLERIVKVESAVAAIQEQKQTVERDRDELKQQLADVLKEVKDGQLYIRDTVMPAINNVQTDVAVLKTRR